MCLAVEGARTGQGKLVLFKQGHQPVCGFLPEEKIWEFKQGKGLGLGELVVKVYILNRISCSLFILVRRPKTQFELKDHFC